MKLLIPVLLLIGGLSVAAGFTASASPVPADLAAPVSASPVEADDAPDRAAPAPADAGIGTSPAPDPTEDPGGYLDALRSAWQSGGWINALVIACLGIALVARKYVKALQKGRAAVVLAAGLAAITAIATAMAAGQAPSLALLANALMAGVLLYLHPDPASKVAPGSLGGGK